MPKRPARRGPSPVFARISRLLALLAAALSGVVWSGPAPAAATSLSALTADLNGRLSLAGSGSSASVYDVTAGQTLLSVRGTVPRPPASVEKLYTAATALQRLGPDARLSTTVLGTGTLTPGGVWEGSLYLRGGGDPTFGSSAFIRRHYGGVGASVSALAGQLVRAHALREITGSIEGDESYLNSSRGEPSSGFTPDPFLEGALSALAFNRGSSGADSGPHAPAVFAARQLAEALTRAGVHIDGRVGAAPSPPRAQPLAVVYSPTISELLGLMLPPSDNFFAETLIKDLGARFGGAGATTAGAAVVRQTISSAFGIHPKAVDGSGLSRANRTSTAQVVELLAALASGELGVVLRGKLAVAGRTGTLAHRMRGTSAAGRCQAKTGTLAGVSNLAGYCSSSSGHLIAFAVFNDGIALELAHAIQDHVAVALANY